jgi:hypothetical protein
MLHGSPTRPAHRATPGGIAELMRQTVTPASGQHRMPAERITLRVPREPQRAMQRVTTGLGAVIVLSICGLITFFIVADERRGHAEPGTEPSAATPWAISSRSVDPEPLRLADVFGAREIALSAGSEPYRVTMTHIDTDCDIATTGALGDLLTAHDCSQVVRAALIAPYGGYEVTAGVFNLADDAGVAEVGRRIRALVESGDGGFAAMAAGAAPGAAPRTVPEGQVGWHERGHYLIYCVIARPDGRVIGADDPYARRITADLLETYLGEQRIGARASAA